MVTKKRKLILIMGTVFCLAGCVSTPRQEPFGEETFSEAEAASAYETVSESMAQAEFENMGGYTVSVSGALVKLFKPPVNIRHGESLDTKRTAAPNCRTTPCPH